MVKTKSNTLPIGKKAENFILEDQLSFRMIELNEYKGEQGTIIIFMCNHCPFVVHTIDKFAEIITNFRKKGISCIGINSNDIENYPADSPHLMPDFAKAHNITFPYVFDASQEVAKNFEAVCTPDIYVYDKNLELYYHGRFDSSTPGNDKPISGEDLTNALENMLLGKSYNDQQPSIGCNIKWKN